MVIERLWFMQKEISVRELEDVVNNVDDIEPMIVKRDSKKYIWVKF